MVPTAAVTGWGTGPVSYFEFQPSSPGSTCGRYTIEYFTFTIGPIGWLAKVVGQPLC